MRGRSAYRCHVLSPYHDAVCPVDKTWRLTRIFPVAKREDVTGKQLRNRINRLGLTYKEAAYRLGLSYWGLHHQMRGERPVTRQTELLLERLEAENPPNAVAREKRRV
jgi:hypothetical protein